MYIYDNYYTHALGTQATKLGGYHYDYPLALKARQETWGKKKPNRKQIRLGLQNIPMHNLQKEQPPERRQKSPEETT